MKQFARFSVLAAGLLGCIMLLTGCSTNQFVAATPITGGTPAIPTPLQTPEFLFDLYPTETISKADYDSSLDDLAPVVRGVVVTIWADSAGIADDGFRTPQPGSKKRFELYLNGERISNSSLRIADGLGYGGPFYLSWAPKLTVGLYEAKIVLISDAGEKQAYSWVFVITE